MEKGSEELNNVGKGGLWNDREGKKVTVGNRNMLFGSYPMPNRFSFETQL